ncbi:MAG: NACHT domain-containing protein [Cyanobacteria bacterium P01_C01_bin.73]
MTGFEPLIGAATAGLAGLIGKVITDKGSDLLTKADIDLFQGREFKRAIQKYVRRYADRHGTLKVACVRMDSPVKLDEIYTAVQLLPRSTAQRYYESTESLQELFRESGKRGFSFHNAKKQQGIKVANEQQYLMVLGGPGVGKSTFLRKMGLEALRRHAIMTNAQNNLAALTPQGHYYAHDCIPVMLALQKFDSKTLSIKDVIAKEFEDCGFPKPQAFTELCLQSGRLLVLLDGLDEVPAEALNHVITEIENLVDRYDHNRFIASCRVAAYTFGGFRRFNDVAMAAFADDQIERFIRNWFQKPRDLETETAKRCWELLSSSDYQAAKELAQTPLLLTLLCVIYDEFQDFPKKRHQVYGEALDVLLRKWASEKRLQKEPIYQQFGSDLELELLSEIAYTSFVDNQLFFPKPTLLGQIQDFQNDNENAPDLDAGRVLYEIEVQQGILVERSRDAYSFSHLTFQEYLTAKCVVDNQKIEQLVRDHLIDQRWREVFLLVAGLVPGKRGAEDLLLQMEKATRQLLMSERLQALVNWADQETQQSPGQYSLVAKRTAALALALARALDLALDRALALARALDLDLALALDRALDLAQIYLNLGIFKAEKIEALIQQLNSLELSANYYQSATEIWNKAINLNDDLLDISETEIEALNNYFYAAELMIRCKEAAVRVSPQVWEGIESRILTVPTE